MLEVIPIVSLDLLLILLCTLEFSTAFSKSGMDYFWFKKKKKKKRQLPNTSLF